MYFSNSEIKIDIENPREDISVFNYYSQDELLNYILNQEKFLTDKQVEHIVKIIKENGIHSIN